MKYSMLDIQTWCESIDSGKYPQGRRRLQSDEGFCCLGVACDLFIPADKQKRSENGLGRLVGDMPPDQPNAPKWLREVDLDFSFKAGYTLSRLNDYERLTLPEIATLLELVYIHKILD